MDQNTTPTVTAIIPAYNAETTIAAAIMSALEQTISFHEIIVVNDGSTDDTQNQVQALIKSMNVKNIRLISIPNSGVGKARNTGIKAASGDLIAFLDSDDRWISEKTQKQLAVFAKYPETVLVCSASTIHKPVDASSLDELSFTSMLFKNSVVTSSVLVKKNVLKTVSFNEKLLRSQDFNLWLKIIKKNRAYKIQETLVIFADKAAYGESGLTKNIHRQEFYELSSFIDLFRQKYISVPQFAAASVFSVFKYVRRCLIVLLRKTKSKKKCEFAKK